MQRLSVLLASAALVLVVACSPAKPPESPEGSSEPTSKEKPEAEASKDAKEEGATPEAKSGERSGERSGEHPPPKSDVDRSMSLDTYEMTPSDCNALGRHYGEVARSDQMVGLSPKLTEKQRSATQAQIDKVVGSLEEKWTDGCHASLVNKAVDHDNIKCALAARTVKDFDVCINGANGTPQGKTPGKKKN